MPRKILSDREFVEHTRKSARIRSERQRQKMIEAGLTALTVWIPATVREALTAKAANDGITIQEATALAIEAALATPQPEPAQPATITASSNVISNVERDSRIRELKAAGLSNPKIGAAVGMSEAGIRRALKRMEATP